MCTPPKSNKLRYDFAHALVSPSLWLGPISNKEHPIVSVTPGQSKFLLHLLFYIINVEPSLNLYQFSLPCLAILGLCHYVVGTCWPFAGQSRYIFLLRVQDKRVHLAPGAVCDMNRLILGSLGEGGWYFFTLVCDVQPGCEKPYIETQGYQIHCLDFAPPESRTDRIDDTEVCETWLRQGLRDGALEIQIIQVVCVWKLLPQLGSRNRLLSMLSYDSLQDMKGPLHSKLSIKKNSFINALKKDKRAWISLVTNHPVVDIQSYFARALPRSVKRLRLCGL